MQTPYEEKHPHICARRWLPRMHFAYLREQAQRVPTARHVAAAPQRKTDHGSGDTKARTTESDCTFGEPCLGALIVHCKRGHTDSSTACTALGERLEGMRGLESHRLGAQHLFLGFTVPFWTEKNESPNRPTKRQLLAINRKRRGLFGTAGGLLAGGAAAPGWEAGPRSGTRGSLLRLEAARAASVTERQHQGASVVGKTTPEAVAYEIDRHGSVYAYRATSTAGAGSLERLADLRSSDWRQRARQALAAAPGQLVLQLRSVFLPEGFPESVGPSYLRYSLWRGAQNVVSAMTAVLSTHALLAAVGLSSTPVAAATSWVLKDGIGQLGKLLTARRGRDFDADPKRYRLSSDLLYDAGLSLEILTPLFPQYFLALAALGNFTKSVAITVGMACRNSVLSSFVLRGNLGDISAKNDAQNVVTNLTGMGLGIVTARALPPKPSVRLGAFAALTALYSVLNYQSMKAVKLNVVNRQRGAIIADSFVRSHAEDVLDVETVNDLECIIPFVPEHFQWLPLKLGVSLERVGRLPPPQRRPRARYVMSMNERELRVALHERAAPRDLLQVLLQSAYLRYLVSVRSGGMERCSPARQRTAIGLPRVCFPLRLSPDMDQGQLMAQAEAYAERYVDAFCRALERRGWNTRVLQLAPDRYRCRW